MQFREKRYVWIAGASLAVLAAFALGLLLASRPAQLSQQPAESAQPAKEPPPAAAQEAKILYWTCAMHPQIREPGPGKCPICGMDLIPVRQGGGQSSLREYVTTPEAAKLLDIETTPVERRFADAHVRMVGKVAYDETRVKYITAWMPGRLDRLYVDYTGVQVSQGDHLVSIYSPELLTAQEELLQARGFAQAPGQGDSAGALAQQTLSAAREKLRLLGLTADQVSQIEQRGTPSDHITIYAPIGGVVVQKMATEGMYVQAGTRLYTIADLSHVWVILDAYESDLEWLRYGQKVNIVTVAYPGETFHGRIAFIDPTVDPVTRTVKVRVDVPNPDGKLKPDMFAHTVVDSEVAAGGKVMAADLAGKWICPMHPDVIEDKPGDCPVCGMKLVKAESLGYVAADKLDEAKPLVIPVTAALATGKRAVVYVKVPDAKAPTFEGREIVLGPRAGDYYLVRSGLKEGEQVVTHGNFNIDSALQILARPSMMTPQGGGQEKVADVSKMSKDEEEAWQGFQDQLEPVVSAAKSVDQAVEAGKLADVKDAYHALGDAVGKVNGDLATGDARLMWKELGMLLNNDAVEGGDSADLADAARVQGEMKGHVDRLVKYYGVKAAATAPARQEAEAQAQALAPAQFRTQFSGVWCVYRDLGAALAADDGAGAAKAAARACGALADVDMGPLQGQAMAEWMADLPKLKADFSATASAGQDLDALRTAFAPLSEDMAGAIRTFGVAPDESVYQMHCPMAFGGKGADWLQPDKQTRNPYLGRDMPTCGELTATLAEKAGSGKGDGAHE